MYSFFGNRFCEFHVYDNTDDNHKSYLKIHMLCRKVAYRVGRSLGMNLQGAVTGSYQALCSTQENILQIQRLHYEARSRKNFAQCEDVVPL